jgi:hypothetical protein
LCVRYSPGSGLHIPTRYAHVGTEQLRACLSVLAKAELTAPAKPRRTYAFNGYEISVDHISAKIGMRGTFTAVSLIPLFSFFCGVLACIVSRKDGVPNLIPVICKRRVFSNFEMRRTQLDPAVIDEVIKLPLPPLFVHAVFTRSTALRHQLTTAIFISFTLATLCADKYHGGII